MLREQQLAQVQRRRAQPFFLLARGKPFGRRRQLEPPLRAVRTHLRALRSKLARNGKSPFAYTSGKTARTNALPFPAVEKKKKNQGVNGKCALVAHTARVSFFHRRSAPTGSIVGRPRQMSLTARAGDARWRLFTVG